MNDKERKQLHDRLYAQGIVIGIPQPLYPDTTSTFTTGRRDVAHLTETTMQPNIQPSSPSPADAQKIAALAKLLGVTDPTDAAAMHAAFDALVPDPDDAADPATVAAHGRALGLNERQIALCLEKGCSVEFFAAHRSRFT